MSNALRQQVAGMTKACKTILARGKELPPVDVTTAQNAVAILAEAKAQNYGNKVLAGIILPVNTPLSSWSWAALLAAMEMVEQSLLLPQQTSRVPGQNGDRLS